MAILTGLASGVAHHFLSGATGARKSHLWTHFLMPPVRDIGMWSLGEPALATYDRVEA